MLVVSFRVFNKDFGKIKTLLFPFLGSISAGSLEPVY